ncbi:hypothetical protein ACFE04_001087 [Oxalis oulophora]
MANCTIFLSCLLILTNCVAGSFSRQDVDNCPDLRCKEDGPLVRFPFYIKGRHDESCGFPLQGFQLSCSKTNDTLLELPVSVTLHVSNISYISQTLDVYDPTGCFLKQLEFLNLSTSPFFYTMDDYNNWNVSIFNCSKYDSSPSWGHQWDDCLVDSNHPFVTVVTLIEEMEDLLPCNKMFNISFVPYGALRSDFLTLGWSKPECRRCEAKHKLCRLKTNSSKSQTHCLNKFPGNISSSRSDLQI